MEARFLPAQDGRSRRYLSQESLALYAWSSTDQANGCDLSKVLEEAPAHARVGLALWLKDAASREANRSDLGMNPERFPQRRSTRLMIPHTAGNSDRVLFTLRLPEPGATPTGNGSLSVPGTAVAVTDKFPLTGAGGTTSPAPNAAAYKVALHGERRARRDGPVTRSSGDEVMAEFAGVPAPAWIMAYQDGSDLA